MKLYRYEDHQRSHVSLDVGGCESYHLGPVFVELREFEVIKHTPCGYWIRYAFGQKWVSAKGRFAHATIEAAVADFKRRKEFQVRLYRARLQRAMQALSLIDLRRDKVA